MAKRGSLTTAYILIALLLILFSSADDPPGGGERQYPMDAPESYTEPDFYSQADFNDPNFRVDLAEQNFGSIPSDKRDDFFQRKYNNPSLNVNVPDSALFENGVLTVGSSTVDMDSFSSGVHTLETQGDKLLVDGNTVKGASNIHLSGGAVAIDRVEYFSSGSVTIANGVNVRVLGDGSIEADKADTVRLGSDGFAGTVQDFSGGQKRFWVEYAGVVNNGCLQAFNASNAEFSLEQDSTTVKASGQTINVNDCGNTIILHAGSNATFTANHEPTQYSITNANLTYEDTEFVEWIQASNGALVTMDENTGFSCMTIMPGGAYFYASKKDKRKDFSAESPLYGIDYRLCIKKDTTQTFTGFDGIIDLIGNMNQLDGTVNHHRYPLRNNALAGVVLEPIYQGLLNPKTRMQLDTRNIYATNMTVIPHEADRTVSKTTASNYLTIKESPGTKDRNTRTWTKINTALNKQELTDNTIMNYDEISITNNVAIYKNTRILSPGHSIIQKIVS